VGGIIFCRLGCGGSGEGGGRVGGKHSRRDDELASSRKEGVDILATRAENLIFATRHARATTCRAFVRRVSDASTCSRAPRSWLVGTLRRAPRTPPRDRDRSSHVSRRHAFGRVPRVRARDLAFDPSDGLVRARGGRHRARLRVRRRRACRERRQSLRARHDQGGSRSPDLLRPDRTPPPRVRALPSPIPRPSFRARTQPSRTHRRRHRPPSPRPLFDSCARKPALR